MIQQPAEKSAGCLFIGLGHDDGEGVGDGAFCGGVGGGHDDFPLTGREVVFFVAGLVRCVEEVKLETL